MSDQTITQLTAISALDDDDLLVVVEDGTTKKVTIAELRAALGSQVLIQEIVVGAGGSATVDFTSIPQTYRHLRFDIMGRVEGTGGAFLFARFNNDSGANYATMEAHANQGGGFGVNSDLATTGMHIAYMTGSDDNAVEIAVASMEVPFYATTDYRKNSIGEQFTGKTNADNNIWRMQTGARWANTAAIDRVTFYSASDIAINSRFALYGVR